MFVCTFPQLTAPISAKPEKAALSPSRVDKAVPTIVRFKLMRSAVRPLQVYWSMIVVFIRRRKSRDSAIVLFLSFFVVSLVHCFLSVH